VNKLNLEEVQTVNELIDTHVHMDSYSVAYVTELSSFVIGVPHWSCQGNFIGKSTITSGATLINIVDIGSPGDLTEFYIYQVDESIVKLLVVSGGIFEIFGSSCEFNFDNKTVSSEYLEDDACYDAYKIINNS
jgi:hypothetical protein